MKCFTFLPLLAAIFATGVSSASLETCNGKDNFFELRSAYFENDPIIKNNEICLLIEGELKPGFVPAQTSIEFAIFVPGFKSSWNIQLLPSLKGDMEPSVGSNQKMRPCFYFPPDLANGNIKIKNNEVSVRIKLTTPNLKDNNKPIRVACLIGSVSVRSN